MKLFNLQFIMTGMMAMLLTATSLTAAAQKYYTLTGKNIVLRDKPGGGVVKDKVSAPFTFRSLDEEENATGGYVCLWHKRMKVYVSRQFIKEITPAKFSRNHLGNYTGKAGGETSYALANLQAKDGCLLMTITDYTAPQGVNGMRGHITHVMAGDPWAYGVNLTHYLYPYNANVSLRKQMTDDARQDDMWLIAAADGKLYAPHYIFEPQSEAKAKVTDTPITERNIFMLKGAVKEMRYVRICQRPFLQSEGVDCPFTTFHMTCRFTTAGDIDRVLLVDGNAKKLGDYVFTHNGDNISVSGSITATYKRTISNFDISYDGRYQSANGTGLINNTYSFNMYGSLFAQTFSPWEPPFTVDYRKVEYEKLAYTYSGDTSTPTAITMTECAGPDDFIYKTTVKNIVKDAHGNWTERRVYAGGTYMFYEKRIISYY